ncbi:MAG: molybdopterin cofactor-binding domain-containing protein, partial [Allosphingosinicella sp.]
IAADGRVIVTVHQAEMGQGVYTSLPQILADELGADWRTVSVEPAPISPIYANLLLADEAADSSAFPSAFGIDRWAARKYAAREALMVTAGSTSVRAFEGPLREAGAGARVLLCKVAAARWGANWEELDTHDGFVWRGTDRIRFAELAEAAADQELPPELPLRGGEDNRLVGRPLPRLDVPAKIDGSALFAGDIRLSDMVHVAVRSTPPGGRRVAIDKAAADAVWDALTVIENPGWIAVAAGNWWAAAKALDALRPRYEAPTNLPSSAALAGALSEAVESGEADQLFATGNADQAFAGASPLSARYAVGVAPSAAIEPLTATARLIGDRLEIWAPTQAPGLALAAAARAVGFPEGLVTLYPVLIGGGYGRKLEMDAIEQAAIIAVKLGRPVQLTWPRIQEIERDRMRPPAAARMSAWISPTALLGWQARIAVPDTGAELARRLGVAGSFFRPDGGPTAGAVPPYAIPNVSIEHVPVEIAIGTGQWRSGAHSYTCFFTECFIDELARAAGLEPLSFRMRMLGQNPRLARVLQTATAIGGWDGGPAGSGMGIAVHSAFGSYVATLVEIEVSREQRIRVQRAVCAVDCGRIVNPEIVRQQIEGGIIHGISAAVGEPVEIVNGTPTARSIGAYRLPILRDSPEVTVELIESDEESGGITELAVPTAAPAVANALFSLTGQRHRTLPLIVGSRG